MSLTKTASFQNAFIPHHFIMTAPNGSLWYVTVEAGAFVTSPV